MDTGDMITKAEIRATMCPIHGKYCSVGQYGFWYCRDRIAKAIRVKHRKREMANRCGQCAAGTYHVHLG